MIIPDNDNILVELRGDYKHVVVPDQKYDTKTRGVCIAVNNKEHEKWLNKRVYWKSYEDDTEIERDGKKFALIEAKVVKGYEEEDVE